MVSFKEFSFGIVISFVAGYMYILQTQIAKLNDICVDQRNLFDDSTLQTSKETDIKFVVQKMKDLHESLNKELFKFQRSILKELKLEVSECKSTSDKLEKVISPLFEKVERIERSLHSVEETLYNYFNVKLEPSNDSIVFDFTSLYRPIRMAKNRTTICNTNFTDAVMEPWSNPLLRFRGILTNIRFTETSRLNFRFKVQYQIVNTLPPGFPVFVLSIGTRAKIDKSALGIDTLGIRCEASLRGETIELQTFDVREVTSLRTVNRNIAGSSATLVFDLRIDGQNGTITCTYYDTGKHIYTFKDVDFASTLIPAFGLFNEYSVHVQLSLF